MKTKILLFAILLFSLRGYNQTWQWTHPEPNGIIIQDPNYNLEDDVAYKTVADNSGNVYELGDYHDSLYLAGKLQIVYPGNTVYPGNIVPRSFIAKYNATGKLLWRILPLPLNKGAIHVTDMATSAQGIFITGTYVSSYANRNCNYNYGDSIFSYSIGSFNFTSEIGDAPSQQEGAMFIAKLDFNGNVLWLKKSNSATVIKEYCRVYAKIGFSRNSPPLLTTDNTGNVIITSGCAIELGGLAGDSVNFTIGGDPITLEYKHNDPYHNQYLLAIKYSDAGILQWYNYAATTVPATVNKHPPVDDYCKSLVADNNGNIFMYCTLNDSCTLGNIHFYTKGVSNPNGWFYTTGALVKLTATGVWNFAKEIVNLEGGGYSLNQQQLAVDNANNVYILSNVLSGCSCGVGTTPGIILGDTLPSFPPTHPAYLVKCTNNGSVLWHKPFGSSSDNDYHGISFANKQLYISGELRNPSGISDSYHLHNDYFSFSGLTVPALPGNGTDGSTYLLAKADTSGRFQWVNLFNSSVILSGYSNCVSGSSIYTCGYYRGSMVSLGHLNGSFSNPNGSIENLFFGKLMDQYIRVGAVTPTSIIPGCALSIPFTSKGLIFSSGNTFTAELSNANGSFTSLTAIGSVASTGTGTVTATIPANFTYGSGYRIRIRSSDTLKTGYNYYAYADTPYVLSLVCPPPSAGFTATNITATAATLNWTAVSCASGYKVQYRVKGTTAWTTATTNTATSTLNATGLTANTIYQWRVATKCRNNGVNSFSAFSTIKQFTTTAASLSATTSGSSNEYLKVDKKFDVTIMPNPAQSSALLTITGSTVSATIIIADMAGKTLWQKNNVMDKNIILPLQNLTNGTYVVTVRDAGNIKTLKLLKQ